VAEAAALADGAPASVRGRVLGDETGYRICDGLGKARPPACVGHHLAITDAGAMIAQLQVALQVDGDVAWSSEEVVLWGFRRGAQAFEPDPAAGGYVIDDPSGSY
jgi:hypothetical protein